MLDLGRDLTVAFKVIYVNYPDCLGGFVDRSSKEFRYIAADCSRRSSNPPANNLGRSHRFGEFDRSGLEGSFAFNQYRFLSPINC